MGGEKKKVESKDRDEFFRRGRKEGISKNQTSTSRAASGSTHALLYRRSRKRVQNVERYTNAKANQWSGDPCGRLVSVNLENEVKPGGAAAALAAALAAAASAGEWKAREELEALAAAAAAAAAELSTPCLTPCPKMLTGSSTKRATRDRGKNI